ncbi:MAG: hypothetical protein HYX99_01785, partial [Chloroflexi bacterium]|nr:hypothetical protein [Chloroflexota bacterium]
MKIEDTLNQCLDLLAGGASLEECLARYPAQREELEPLLRAALTLRRSSTMPLRPGFREEGRARVLGALAALRARRRAPNPGQGWAWRGALASLLIVFLLGGQVVRASAQSLPGDTLYSVKRAVEQVRLTLALSPEARAQVSREFADQRTQELVAVAQKRDLWDDKDREWFQKQTESLVEHQASRLQGVAKLADKGVSEKDKEAMASKVREDFERQQASLWQLVERAPEAAQPALREAVEKATGSYQRALEAITPP